MSFENLNTPRGLMGPNFFLQKFTHTKIFGSGWFSVLFGKIFFYVQPFFALCCIGALNDLFWPTNTDSLANFEMWPMDAFAKIKLSTF